MRLLYGRSEELGELMSILCVPAPQELASFFPEFQAVAESAGNCRFANCLHASEPGCVIRAADPPLTRYPHYLKFLKEIQVGVAAACAAALVQDAPV